MSSEVQPKILYHQQFSPIISGSLYSKCSDGRFYKHYYELTTHRLLQYTNSKREQLIMCLDFRSSQLQSFNKSGKCIKIVIRESSLTIKAKNQEETNKWYLAITSVIGLSSNTPCESTHLKLDEIYINQSQLLKFADTFDILLFKSTNKTASLQRMLTGSVYDHIGLLMIAENDKIFMIQSTSRTGVTLLNQQSILKKIKSSRKVGYRKMLSKKKQVSTLKLQNSLSQLLNCKYEFSLSKLFGSQKSQTYFCSQLVAQIYKKCDILDCKKASSKFWPSDFQCADTVDNLQFGKILTVVL